jgi:hypothetical protein
VGTWGGNAGFFAAIGKTGPVTEFTPLAYASNDDGDVMVFIRYAFTVTATGKARRDEHAPLLEVPRREGVLRAQFRGHGAGSRGPHALTRIHKRPGPPPGPLSGNAETSAGHAEPGPCLSR